MKQVPKNYKKIDSLLNKVSKNLEFSLVVRPINSHLIKEDFFETQKDPYLAYKANGHRLLKYRNKLKNLKIKRDSPIAYLLNKKRVDLIKKIDLITSRGNGNFTRNCIRVYGKPDRAIINKAKKILKSGNGKKIERIPIKKVLSMIKDCFKDYGLNWKVKTEHIISSANVSASKKTIYLKKKARFSKRYVKRLIVHEIETHVLRTENARKQQLKIFFNGLPGYLATEEGLAVYNEERNNLLDTNTLRNYAGRVIAVDLALKNSFRDTFKALRKYFRKGTAFRLTLRAKRGLGDTSLPGAYTKDYLYLKGYFDVKNFIRNGGSIKDLYYGKISVNDVPIIKKIKDYLREPKYI